ncbi:hypothetical protein IMCC20628_02733 [Hoeflea sp. IMCC20628]|uniref:hypothetical protein n=1 Tax=Hoeflea sp. IMCC20628 TaxID=1620421 RepID=UPI00063BD534|nr:hypothetical protein [Hoeflea sp. IMCC20628]AKI01429.1 hypothetical protein IMCC20628_02733 [Hoeflea sp. IMCC20628]
MTLSLANDEQTLTLGGNTVRLRPSLRAAARLERLHNGLAGLSRSISEFHIGTIRDIIKAAATDHDQAKAFIAAFDAMPLNIVASTVAAPIIALITGCVPASSDDDKPSTTGKPVPWQTVYKELYRIATGWLGWTPETAWNATPTEINEAFTGHVAKLKAIHGSNDNETSAQQSLPYSADHLKEIDAQGFDPAFDRDGLTSVRNQIARKR